MYFKIFKKTQWNCILIEKIWVDKGSKFYNNSFKKWLRDNDMYSTNNEGKSVLAEIFIKEHNLQIYDFNIKKCVY